MRRKVMDNPLTPAKRRDIFGAPRSRYSNRFRNALKGRQAPDDPLDLIVSLPEVTDAPYLDEEPWMADVTARLSAAYEDADAMPGCTPLHDVREERLSQACACGMRQIEAFKFAGYSTTFPEIFHDRKLLHRIAYHRRVGADACAVTAERIVAELSAIAFSKVSDAAKWAGGQVSLKPSETLPSNVQRAIASVSQGRDGITIKHHSKVDSLRILSQFKGMLKDKVELSGPDGKPIEQNITRDMDPRKAAEAYAELLKEGST